MSVTLGKTELQDWLPAPCARADCPPRASPSPRAVHARLAATRAMPMFKCCECCTTDKWSKFAGVALLLEIIIAITLSVQFSTGVVDPLIGLINTFIDIVHYDPLLGISFPESDFTTEDMHEGMEKQAIVDDLRGFKDAARVKDVDAVVAP